MPETSVQTTPSSGTSAHAAILAAGWLVPGAGLYLFGLKNRGLVAFALLQTTFVLGVLFRGSISLPDMSAGADGFNIVAILVFIISMGNGGLGLLSLIGDVGGGAVRFLAHNPAHDYADLGQLYLLVSGGMNYFLLMSLLSPVGHAGLVAGTGAADGESAGK